MNIKQNKSWVYLLTIDNKGYVGVTEYPQKRYETHIRELSSGKHVNKRMQRAYKRTNGAHSFKILEEVPCWEGFDEELYWIYRLETYIPSNGYNDSDCRIKSYKTHEYTQSHWMRLQDQRTFRVREKRNFFDPTVICLPDLGGT